MGVAAGGAVSLPVSRAIKGRAPRRASGVGARRQALGRIAVGYLSEARPSRARCRPAGGPAGGEAAALGMGERCFTKGFCQGLHRKGPWRQGRGGRAARRQSRRAVETGPWRQSSAEAEAVETGPWRQSRVEAEPQSRGDRAVEAFAENCSDSSLNVV